MILHVIPRYVKHSLPLPNLSSFLVPVPYSLQPCSIFSKYFSSALPRLVLEKHKQLLRSVGSLMACAVFHQDTLSLSLSKPLLKQVYYLQFTVCVQILSLMERVACVRERERWREQRERGSERKRERDFSSGSHSS